MELEHYICLALGAIGGMLAVMFAWMRSPDFEDAERYRWLKATTNFVTNSSGERIDVRGQAGIWDAAIDRQRAAAQQGTTP